MVQFKKVFSFVAGFSALGGVVSAPLANATDDLVPRGTPRTPHFVVYTDSFTGTTGPPPVSQVKAAEWTQLSAAQRSSIKSQYAAAGIKLIVSAFGSTDTPTSSGADPIGTANTMAAWVKQYDLDGIDVDYEDFNAVNAGDGSAEAWLASFTRQLRNQLPHGQYLLTHAPVAPWFSPGKFGGGAYLKVHKTVGSLIDWYNIQFYNPVYPCPNVGGGAAGMSAAYAFSRHPERFNVTLYERSSYLGGMATSTSIDGKNYGADYINDGVQGASPVFHNTYAIFEKLGFSASDIRMQVSFGRDPEVDFWSNVFPSRVIDKLSIQQLFRRLELDSTLIRFSADIKKFGKVLKIIKALEPLFAEFGEVILFPLVALFFGTGNQTPFISCAILERVFMDPNMRLFEYSSESFLASMPTMCAFPRLSTLYDAWKSLVEEQGQGSVRVINEREVTRVVRSSRKESGGVQVWSRSTRGTDNEQSIVDPGEEERETFDEIVICTDADAALSILGKDAGWLERRILGNVKYLWDVTVTHNDLDYMEKYYRVHYDTCLHSTLDSDNVDKQRKFEFAERHFSPLYFIRSYPADKRRVEMSFDLTAYQPQFDGVPPSGPPLARGDEDNGSSSKGNSDRHDAAGGIPLKDHVFQTIFLDNSPQSARLWSKEEIKSNKVCIPSDKYFSRNAF
ncbi:hypothetical protein DXG03_009011 [Asterophora parasitica]|uniref:Chitinase n=1 Tax=Asterophora parasitica TaxID=117018 RepID=A0A9P7GBD1_9AGAR|nr:hypothetical protein DXG03_009011 [Asterophora parasitica]